MVKIFLGQSESENSESSDEEDELDKADSTDPAALESILISSDEGLSENEKDPTA